MQKSFIAIALALTLSCALAGYSPIAGGYVKNPVSVAGDNESNFTNSASLQLVSVNMGELDLIGSNNSNGATAFTNSWVAAYRKLDGKALTASTNSSLAYTGGLSQAFYVNGFAISWAFENDTNNIPQISVYQTPVSGGATVPKIVATSNNNSWWKPMPVGVAIISKTVYVFYIAVNTSNVTTQVNVSNFVAGGAKGSSEFNLTTAYAGGLNVAWGEALGSNQLFANWMEAGVLKDATVDVSKGTVNVNAVVGWNGNLTCTTFSTDKKWFGDLCYDARTNLGNISYSVRSTNTSLVALVTNATNTTSFAGVFPYGPYIAILYTDTVMAPGRTTYSYDIWNLDSFTPNRNKTAVVSYDFVNSTVTFFRVTSGGLYTLLSNNAITNTSTMAMNSTSIQVGLVLGSSYLTSVLGFILTIVAGLLLF